MNLFDEFKWRGMLHEATPDLREVLAKEKLTAYIGFDPSAALASNLPLSGETNGTDVVSESTTSPVPAMVTSVSPQYFETMRLPLARGRDFSAADREGAAERGQPQQGVAQPLGRRSRPQDTGAAEAGQRRGGPHQKAFSDFRASATGVMARM